MKPMIRPTVIAILTFLLKVFYRHKVYGKGHIHKGGAIVAANHSSYLDPPIIGVSCPDNVHFLARASLFRFPIFGAFIRSVNTHPVKPGAGNIGTFKLAYELLADNKKVVIFPEGRRSPDGVITEGKLGVGVLVFRARCQVIPTYIHGAYEAWSAQRKFPKRHGRTACVFGTPLDFSHLFKTTEKKKAQAQIAHEIMVKIKELRHWYLDGAKGPVP